MELLHITQNISYYLCLWTAKTSYIKGQREYVYLSSKQPDGGHVAVSKLSFYLLVTTYIKFKMLVAKEFQNYLTFFYFFFIDFVSWTAWLVVGGGIRPVWWGGSGVCGAARRHGCATSAGAPWWRLGERYGDEEENRCWRCSWTLYFDPMVRLKPINQQSTLDFSVDRFCSHSLAFCTSVCSTPSF